LKSQLSKKEAESPTRSVCLRNMTMCASTSINKHFTRYIHDIAGKKWRGTGHTVREFLYTPRVAFGGTTRETRQAPEVSASSYFGVSATARRLSCCVFPRIVSGGLLWAGRRGGCI